MARSIKKGPYVSLCLQKKVDRVKAKEGRKEIIKTWKRASIITPDFVGLTIAVHDGRRFNPIFITENMVGHALGEFAPTRTFRMHSGQRKAGVAPSPSVTPTSSVTTSTPAPASVSTLPSASTSKSE